MIDELETRVGIATGDKTNLQSDTPYHESYVAHLVHEALLAGGLGQRDPDAPLGDIIQPGMSVLLKPNWVLHTNHSGQGMECMVTQPEFILAVLSEVVTAKPAHIWIGDAPIQSCDFQELVTSVWQEKFRQAASCPVEILDFRRTILKRDASHHITHQSGRDTEFYVLFDLGEDSLLEPISRPVGRFRVTSYNPEDLARKHAPGLHQYLLCREAFQADVIINLPKLKCHSKAGVTAALKNLVGLNGNKDYLPHHRVGGTALGGDCYPGLAPFKRVAEYCLDQANRRIGTSAYFHWRQAALRLQNLHRRFGNPDIEGSWYGNDTVWRMTLDLNRLLLYGREDGTLADTQLRRIYTLTDGIVAGQRDGPLSPVPVRSNMVTFASNSAFADLAHTALMHFDWRKIPLVREAFQVKRFPLTHHKPQDCQVFHTQSQRFLSLTDVAKVLGNNFVAPKGWKNHIEWDGGEL